MTLGHWFGSWAPGIGRLASSTHKGELEPISHVGFGIGPTPKSQTCGGTLKTRPSAGRAGYTGAATNPTTCHRSSGVCGKRWNLGEGTSEPAKASSVSSEIGTGWWAGEALPDGSGSTHFYGNIRSVFGPHPRGSQNGEVDTTPT